MNKFLQANTPESQTLLYLLCQETLRHSGWSDAHIRAALRHLAPALAIAQQIDALTINGVLQDALSWVEMQSDQAELAARKLLSGHIKALLQNHISASAVDDAMADFEYWYSNDKGILGLV